LILTRADADRAGLAHDHLFVGWEQGEQARALLSELWAACRPHGHV